MLASRRLLNGPSGTAPRAYSCFAYVRSSATVEGAVAEARLGLAGCSVLIFHSLPLNSRTIEELRKGRRRLVITYH